MQTQTLLDRPTISLKGSAQIVSEFFQFAINNILYQRSIYPEQSFDRTNKYGCELWLTTDKGLSTYLESIEKQMKVWLEAGKVKQLVLIVTEADSKEVVERWTFDIDTNKDALKAKGPIQTTKTEKEIHNEIKAIMRQIAASVSFLPMLDNRCTIDILVYMDNDLQDIPDEWEDSDARNIADADMVALRGFSTKIHTVKPMVTYKKTDQEII